MYMREHKIRIWDADNNEMLGPFDLTQNPIYWADKMRDGVLIQYTGLKDVNGVEIYEGDIIRHTENVRVGTTRSRRGRSRKYDTFAVYGDREVISVVHFDVFENTLGFITSTNSNTAYDSYFFGEGKRTDKPNLCIQNLTDRLNVKKEYEVIGNIYENKELLEEK